MGTQPPMSLDITAFSVGIGDNTVQLVEPDTDIPRTARILQNRTGADIKLREFGDSSSDHYLTIPNGTWEFALPILLSFEINATAAGRIVFSH